MTFNIRLRDPGFILENVAGILTCLGMYFGSTNSIGVVFYLLSLIFWWLMICHRRLWGLLFFQVSTTIIVVINVWRIWGNGNF